MTLMQRFLRLILVLLVVLGCSAASPAAQPNAAQPNSVAQVDLTRYTGQWFEIARTPNFWQRQCASDVTARYDLQPGGKFVIHNECKKSNGETTSGDGYAVGSGNGALVSGKLRVSFFRPFYFDYWVVALDPNYSWAVVAEPKRQNLWIIARTPVLDRTTRELIDRQITVAGFDPKSLVETRQTHR